MGGKGVCLCRLSPAMRYRAPAREGWCPLGREGQPSVPQSHKRTKKLGRWGGRVHSDQRRVELGPKMGCQPPQQLEERVYREESATEMAGGSESQSENSQVAGYFKDNRKARYPWAGNGC